MSPDSGLDHYSAPINTGNSGLAELDGVRCFVTEVTPELAQAWLNTLPKPIEPNPLSLSVYVRDMKAGLWRLNACPIIFGQDGVLLDGHVRLHACLSAGTSFRSLIVEGISADRFLTIDEMRRRSLASILAIRKENSGQALSAVLRLVWQYYFNPTDDVRRRASVRELLFMLDARPDLRDTVNNVPYAQSGLPRSTACALYHLGCRVDKRYTDLFFLRVNDLTLTDSTLPPVLLRQTITRLSQAARRDAKGWFMAVGIKAWNAGRSGTVLRELSWKTIDKRERQPIFEGLGEDDGSDLVESYEHGGAPPAEEGDLRTSVEFITPEAAQYLLNNNTNNRPMLSGVVDRYMRDMLAGQWKLNGQTIKIGRSGRLLDGQHRCQASVDSGCSFPAIVVHNVDDNAFDTLDLGTRRRFAQVLKVGGEQYVTALAGAVRSVFIYQYKSGRLRSETPTNTELQNLYRSHPEIRESAKFILDLNRHLLERSASIALHFAFSIESRAKADEFFQRLADGINLTDGQPILFYRNRLIDSRESPARRLSLEHRIALAIKAWRAHVDDRTLRRLFWAESTESFPKLVWLRDKEGNCQFEDDVEDIFA